MFAKQQLYEQVAKPGGGALVEDASGGGAGRRPALGGEGVATRPSRNAPGGAGWGGAGLGRQGLG